MNADKKNDEIIAVHRRLELDFLQLLTLPL